MKKLLLLLLFVFLAGCTKQNQNEAQNNLSRNFLIGVAGYVPKNYPNQSDDDWRDFFAELPLAGEVFGNYVNWQDTSQINLTMSLTKSNGMIPVIAIGFNIEQVNSTYFTDNKKAMQDSILAAVNNYNLPYLAIGVEVNRVISIVGNDSFNDFVNFYRETYDLIKAASPSTKVFTIFQLELMKGKAKLMGNNNISEQWRILDSFEGKSDLIGFTVYPFLEYNNASEIPSNYYSEISSHTNGKIAFTEIGWPSNLSIINTSEQVQLIFLQNLINQTKELDIEFLIYSFLHDGQFHPAIFDTIGLKHKDGTSKPAYNYWASI